MCIRDSLLSAPQHILREVVGALAHLPRLLLGLAQQLVGLLLRLLDDLLMGDQVAGALLSGADNALRLPFGGGDDVGAVGHNGPRLPDFRGHIAADVIDDVPQTVGLHQEIGRAHV